MQKSDEGREKSALGFWIYTKSDKGKEKSSEVFDASMRSVKITRLISFLTGCGLG